MVLGLCGQENVSLEPGPGRRDWRVNTLSTANSSYAPQEIGGCVWVDETRSRGFQGLDDLVSRGVAHLGRWVHSAWGKRRNRKERLGLGGLELSYTV